MTTITGRLRKRQSKGPNKPYDLTRRQNTTPAETVTCFKPLLSAAPCKDKGSYSSEKKKYTSCLTTIFRYFRRYVGHVPITQWYTKQPSQVNTSSAVACIYKHDSYPRRWSSGASAVQATIRSLVSVPQSAVDWGKRMQKPLLLNTTQVSLCAVVRDAYHSAADEN